MDKSIKIIVVDDMPTMRGIVRNMLAEFGFNNVAEAEDGEAAWQMIRDAATLGVDPIRLIISDWNMPGMSGVDLLRALRSFTLTQDVPFLMVTAEGDQPHIADAVRAGVTDYIVKPFSSSQLAEKIGRYVP